MAFGMHYQIDYFSGWRYLFSSRYRDQVKQKWGKNLILKSMFLIGSVIGILLTSAAAVLLVQLVWFLITSEI
jgi:cytosine/uracil/thiamine/allantoin permease